MGDRMTVKKLAKIFNIFIAIVLMCTGNSCAVRICHRRLDIVIAVDTTSSTTDSSFDDVKQEVKAMVSGFSIGQALTRLALISISSQQVNVLANFLAVASVSNFNAAVDRMKFDPGKARLSKSINGAKSLMLTAARSKNVAKILILVKDRRDEFLKATADVNELSAMTSEVTALKSIGVSTLAVGIGGLWNALELKSLFGSDYLLFKSTNRALESAKSLNHGVCDAECPLKGTQFSQEELCYNSTRHMIHFKVDLAENVDGVNVCRTEIDRVFATCDTSERCNKRDRLVSTCGNDSKLTVETTWPSFDPKLQSCITSKKTHVVDCADAMKCSDQVADVIFILDRSDSIMDNFPKMKNATRVLIDSLNVGPDNVRVGVMTFSLFAQFEIDFGAISDKAALLSAVDALPVKVMYNTQTHTALRLARQTFAKQSRGGVTQYVFLLTDGDSSSPEQTFEETALIKQAGVTIFAVGISRGGYINTAELKTMTAPESNTNLFTLTSFDALKAWSDSFSKKLCLHMAPPNPKLCEDAVFTQSISECTYGKQQLSWTGYLYDHAKKCIKTFNITEYQGCKLKCTNPIDGNEYFEGDRWTSLCHEFHCVSGKTTPLVPVRSKCLAADGTCKEVGSQAFRCRDSQGVEQANCHCQEKNGRSIVVIEAQ